MDRKRAEFVEKFELTNLSIAEAIDNRFSKPLSKLPEPVRLNIQDESEQTVRGLNGLNYFQVNHQQRIDMVLRSDGALSSTRYNVHITKRH